MTLTEMAAVNIYSVPRGDKKSQTAPAGLGKEQKQPKDKPYPKQTDKGSGQRLYSTTPQKNTDKTQKTEGFRHSEGGLSTKRSSETSPPVPQSLNRTTPSVKMNALTFCDDDDDDDEQVDVVVADLKQANPQKTGVKTPSTPVVVSVKRNMANEKDKMPVKVGPRSSEIFKEKTPEYIDFCVPFKDAIKHLQEWGKDRILVPLDMTTQFHQSEFEAFYCPFLLFSFTAITSVGITKLKDVAPDLPSFKQEFEKEKMGYLSREFVSHISPWRFEEAQSEMFFKETKRRLAEKAGGLQKVRVLDVMSQDDVWEREVKPKQTKLLLDSLGSSVNKDIKFIDTKCRVVYVPVYASSFTYQDKTYYYVLNGKKGNDYGEAPTGVGGLVKAAVRLFTGSLFDPPPSVYAIMGDRLCEMDKCDYYRKDHIYIVLPDPSGFFFFGTCGKCRLKNIAPTLGGRDSLINCVIIRAHFRLNRRIANTAVIKPGEVIQFSFYGSWVLEILEGDNTKLCLFSLFFYYFFFFISLFQLNSV